MIKVPFKLEYLLLAAILILGLFLRLYKLDAVPAGFFADEASIGYNAFTILTQGKDEHGIPHPIFFKAFGEYKNPLQIYSTVPFVALFGLNEFSVRLASVVYGVLGILALFLLVRELFPQQEGEMIALLSAFFLAISPWHIHISRVALEGIAAFVFFTTLAVYFFLKSKNSPLYLLLSVITFTVSLYSYFPARVFVPLLTLSLAFLYRRFFLKHRVHTMAGLFILFLLIFPFFQALASPSGWARWEQVSIFSQPPASKTATQHIIKNYFSHFSPDFLFLKGDIGMPGSFITRHSVKGIGELYLFQLPLTLLGIVFIIKNKQKATLFLLGVWLVLYPLGSAFTVDESARATRSIIGVIPWQILSAAGLFYLLTLFSKNFIKILLTFLLTVIIFLSFQIFLQKYFQDYPLYSSDYWGWQYGPKEIMGYFLSHKDNFDDLYLSGEFNAPEIFLKFYDPGGKCLNKCRIGNLTSYNPARKQLFAVSSKDLSNSPLRNYFDIYQTIYYPNKNPAFYLGEIHPNNSLSL